MNNIISLYGSIYIYIYILYTLYIHINILFFNGEWVERLLYGLNGKSFHWWKKLCAMEKPYLLWCFVSPICIIIYRLINAKLSKWNKNFFVVVKEVNQHYASMHLHSYSYAHSSNDIIINHLGLFNIKNVILNVNFTRGFIIYT